MHPVLETLRPAFHDPSTRAYRAVEWAIYGLILVSAVLIAVEIGLGSEHPVVRWLALLDHAILVVFAAEVGLRIATYRPPALDFFDYGPARRLRTHILGRLRFCAHPLIVIDLLAVVALVPELRGLRALRLLRLVRTAKVFKYSNPFAGLARAVEENRLLFAFGLSMFGMSALVGGLSIYLVERAANPAIDSIGDGIWWAVVTLTTVGFGDITPQSGMGRIVGGVLMVAGMFTLAMFAGIVGHTLLGVVLGIRQEQFRMNTHVNHLIVCGYQPGAHQLVNAILAEPHLRRMEVVIFARGERPSDLPSEFTWVSGDPTKESELDKVRLTHAYGVLVVGARDLLPQQADAITLLTVFTLRRYMKGKSPPAPRRPLYVVVEILDPENVDHAKAAGCDEVIETTRVGYSLLTHAIAQPGTAAILGRVAAAGSQSLYVGPRPDQLGPEVTFGDAARVLKAKHGVLLLGLNIDGEDVMNPPDDAPVPAGARLVYLAESDVLGHDEDYRVP